MRRRFRGLNKLKKGVNPRNSYCIPSMEVQDVVFAGIEAKENHLFLVPSKVEPSVKYMVDMALGRCQCQVYFGHT